MRTGLYLAQRLESLAGVATVRGRGLLLGAVLEPGLDAAAITAAALEEGLVVNAPVPGVLRLAPPLNVSVAEVDEAIAILARVLESSGTTSAETRARV
jgi:acetylornithine/succinyldiaminopimelate/putrescine aminotransferase